jgi:group I intron endonuclease
MKHPCGGIYLILSKATGRSYIGSAIHFKNRWTGHRSSFRRGDHYNPILLAHWDKYGEDDFEYWILEFVPNADDLLPREQWWIDDLHPQMNIAPVAGATRGIKHPAASVEARAAKNRGRKMTPEQVERCRQANLVRFQDPEERERHAERMRNRRKDWMTEEYREKLSKASSGRKYSDAARASMSAAQKGRPKSDAHKEKLRQALLGKTLPDEVKQKLSVALKNRYFSPEHRQRISDAGRKAWERRRAEGRDKHTEAEKQKIGAGVRRYLQGKPKP